jgi:ribonuclease HI
VFGAIQAMDWAVSNGCADLIIFHDYEGLGKWVSGEWEAKSEVAQMFVSVYKAKFEGILRIKFEKIVGHSHHKYNDKADELAKRALSDNARIPIQGDNWYGIDFLTDGELKSVLNLLTEDLPKTEIRSSVESDRTIYRLSFKTHKLTVTAFNTGKRKLLVQGNNSIIFQIFTTYVNELKDVKQDYLFGSAYRKTIDKNKVTNDFNHIFSSFEIDYPEDIKRLLKQSIINLSYYIESEDYSQYVFPALRAIEGHLKYHLGKSGIIVTSKSGFRVFEKDEASGGYSLPPKVAIDDPSVRSNLEECYNFFHATRHTIFHSGDNLGPTDSTRIVETKKEADELIYECFRLINNGSPPREKLS